jgi:hypothetical protein
MTSTTKRRIAREWLIFLLAIGFGLVITYCAFYFGRQLSYTLDHYDYTGHWVKEPMSKYRNPGDLFNDLTSGQNAGPPCTPPTLWLCVLSPYFVFWFVRSIIWSVKALGRH